MSLANIIAIEQSIADVLLKCLSQGLDPEECAFHLERRAIDLFLRYREAPNVAVSPVILEAVTTFASAHPSLKLRALSALLVLSASSVASWNSVAMSKIFQLHRELYELLARSIVNINGCFDFLSLDVSRAISVAFIALSEFDTYERHARLRRLPTTPASLVIQGFFGNLTDKKKLDSPAAGLLSNVLRSLSLKALESIPDDDWAKVLDLALESDVKVEFVNVRTLLGISRDTSARREMLRVARKHPESAIALQMGLAESIASPQASLMSIEKIFSSLSEINTPEKAYQLIKRTCAEGDEKSVQSAAAKWLYNGQIHLVGAAYLAAPNALNSLVDSKNAVCSAMKELPVALWSPLDEVLDDNLADLLSSIPELARVLLRRNGDNGKSAHLSLKRIALIHPFLVARRLQCLSSSCRAVLHGLTNNEQRYERPSLHVLEVLFDVIGTLPVGCLQIQDIQDICAETLDFLLEENRAENGVPDMFADLATAVFKCLSRFQGTFRSSRLQELVTKVETGAGTSTRIKEAAETLLSLLLTH